MPTHPLNPYHGRFAPSPSGPLHLGSLINAVASYCQARKNDGLWFVRIENIDPPREVAGAADKILSTLETFGLHWDGEVLYQNDRTDAYQAAMQQLQQVNLVYPCACSRREIAAVAEMGTEGPIYPQTCRNGLKGRPEHNWRFKAPDQVIHFSDVIFRQQSQNVAQEIGDFIVKRAGGYFAYQLGVVVDDAYQGITEVVRGADILLSTARQIALQTALGYHHPNYLHHPVALQPDGDKLSKSKLAPDIATLDAMQALRFALAFLRQPLPEAADAIGDPESLLEWAVKHWDSHLISQENHVVDI